MASLSGSRSRSGSASDVWAEQAPYLQDLYGQAQQLYGQFQPNEQLYNAASQGLQGQMNPQGNPYLQQMGQQYQQAYGQLAQGTGGQAQQLGQYGGGRQGVQDYLNQQNVGNQMGQFYGQQYQQDQNRALQAIGMAPGIESINPFQQQQNALAGYGQAIGGPAMTSQSSSRSKGGGASVGG